MARSINPDWTQTAGQLCHSAARELGAIGLGGTLEDAEQDEMLTRLNSMLAFWSLDGNLFREETDTITITAGNASQTLDAGVRDIRGARYVESGTYKRPLVPWNRDEYYSLPNAAASGPPTIYYFSKQLGGGVLSVWPVPSTDATIELDISRGFYFVESPTQELDLPPEWHQAALYGLAARSAGIFGATRLDPGAVQRADQQSAASYQRLLDADRPDEYVFDWESPVRAYPYG